MIEEINLNKIKNEEVINIYNKLEEFIKYLDSEEKKMEEK